MVKGIIPIIAQKENLDSKKNMIYLQSDIDMSQQSVCFRRLYTSQRHTVGLRG